MKAKKQFGQHFLTDWKIADRIAKLATQSDTKAILEIGPGKGILTKELLKLEHKTLLCSEIDTDAQQYLIDNSIIDESKIIMGDFLDLNLNDYFDQEFILTGNYPYNISSQIVFKMLENYQKIPLMAGMFQKEVAERLVAKPNNKVYGILSVLLQVYYDCKIEFTLPPGAFSPPPKVNSAVIICKRKAINETLDYKKLKAVVKAAFNQRRKQLCNALSMYEIEKIPVEFRQKRAEQLSLENFIEISKSI